MQYNHEYSVLGGMKRSTVGRCITVLASFLSGAAVVLLTDAFQLASNYGLSANVPPTVLSLVGAGVLYTALYWAFDQFCWKWIRRVTKLPDLSGEWHCEGRTLGDGHVGDWDGKITIVQSFDKIKVSLSTKQSTSSSRSAALFYEEGIGYRLSYNYKNEPRIGEEDLAFHWGCCELLFDVGLTRADGEYFNGHGRKTFGTMHLERV